ncbi:unnamed protein product [Polarella glacialis]|uniref:Uncharacterized protein n=1 Tax=Polarella glacialis TaxID=89957 RepID=A0A813JIR8_POLGL|nr:unnamed protein product [Polarella glacialis]
MEAFFVNRPDACRAGSLLELGMGTGKVALQLFLSLPGCSVFGVELAPSRWALADAALRRLAEAVPERFRHEPVAEHRARLLDLSNGEEPRVFDIVCGSLLDTPIDILAGASAVVMEVCLPKEVQRQACRVLQHCQVGCRVVCYAPLHGMVEPCRLAPVRLPPGATDTSALLGDGQGGLALAASWKPHGHGFAFYAAGLQDAQQQVKAAALQAQKGDAGGKGGKGADFGPSSAVDVAVQTDRPPAVSPAVLDSIWVSEFGEKYHRTPECRGTNAFNFNDSDTI